jgi:hypothetical protein
VGEVYYGIDDDDPSTRMTSEGGDDYSAEIDSNTLTEGPHTIFVKAINGTGLETVVSIQVDVDRNSPMVMLTSQGGVASGDFFVSAIVEDPYLNESAIYCVVDDDLEASRGYLLTRVDDHFEIHMDTTGIPDGDHVFRVWAFDRWGSSNKSHGEGMLVDNSPPVIDLRSEGGVQSGLYILRVEITEPNIDALSVEVTVGDDDPIGMVNDGEEWSWRVATPSYPNGELLIQVDAADTLGHTATQTIILTVDNRADLVISDVDWTKRTVVEGDRLDAKVTVRNDGTANATDFKIVIVEEGRALATTKVSKSLGPGTSSTYTVSWEAKGQGERSLSIQVDPDDTVDELNEDDNIWGGTQDISVEEDTPGPGALMAMCALLLAFLLFMGRRG